MYVTLQSQLDLQRTVMWCRFQALRVCSPSTSSPVSGPPRLSSRTPTLVVSSSSSKPSALGTSSSDKAATSSKVAVVAAPKAVAAIILWLFTAELLGTIGENLLLNKLFLRLAAAGEAVSTPKGPKAEQRPGTADRQQPKRQHAVRVQPAPSWDGEEALHTFPSPVLLLRDLWCIICFSSCYAVS